MQRFQRLNLDGDAMSARHRRALRACRQPFVQEMDAQEVLADLAGDTKLRPEVREQIANFSTREQRAGALLDWLMTRGDRTFWLFADALRGKRRTLYGQLEAALKKEIEEEEVKVNEKTMSGEGVRKIIVRRINDRSLSATIAAPDSDDGGEGRLEAEADYVDCYVIPMRGKLQRETWLRKKYEPQTDSVSKDNESGPYMTELAEGTVFKKIDASVVPDSVKKPPAVCEVYVVDGEKTPESVLEAEKQSARKSIGIKLPSLAEVDAAVTGGKIITEAVVAEEAANDAPTEPPPLPPKPDSLPPIALTGAPKTSFKDKVTNQDLSLAKEADIEEEPPVKPPERTTSKQKAKPLPLPKPEGLGAKLSSSPSGTVSENANATTADVPVTNDLPPVPLRPQKTKPPANRQLQSTQDGAAILASSNEEEPEKFENDIIEEEENADAPSSSGGTKLNCVQSPMYDQMYETEETKSLDIDEEQPLYGDDVGIRNDRNEAVKSNSADNLIGRNMSNETRDRSKWSSFDSGLAGESSSFTSPLKTTAEHQSFGVERPVNSHADDPLSRSVRRESVSSGADSFYEDIDTMGERNIPAARFSFDSRPFYLAPQVPGREPSVSSTPAVRITSLADLAPATLVLHKGQLLLAERTLACEGEVTVPGSSEKKDSTPVTESSGDSAVVTSSDSGGSNESVDAGITFTGTVLTMDKTGRSFYIPRKLLKCHGDPTGEVWFYPLPISSKQATIFLAEVKSEGTFLVYKPIGVINSAVRYTLSVTLRYGDIVHYQVVENIHGDLLVEGDDHSFLTIKALVHYFQSNKGRLATRLRRPLKEANLAITPGYHYEARWEVDRAALKLSGNVIGQGSYGYMCSGVYGRSPVSIKILQRTDITTAKEDDFVEEAKVLMTLNHEHIINFVGLSCKSRPFYLVCELVSRGSLRESLRNMTRTIDTLFDFCLQITSALLYLEEQHFVLHRDLAVQQFFLGDDGCIKLGEFGRARRVDDDNYQASRSEKLSVKWAAPEVLMHSTYSTKSDVWAMGVVFWEIFSYGERPYSTLTSDQTAVYVVEGGRLERPKGCPQDIYSLMKSCWQESPDDRPSFAQIHNNLKSKSSVYYFGPIKYRTPIAQSHSIAVDTDAKAPPLPSAAGKNKAVKTRRTVAESVPTYEVKAMSPVTPQRSVSDNYYGTEVIEPATSEVSLATLTNDSVDLSRGDKIRKSLRNLIPHKKSSKSSSMHSKASMTLSSSGSNKQPVL